MVGGPPTSLLGSAATSPQAEIVLEPLVGFPSFIPHLAQQSLFLSLCPKQQQKRPNPELRRNMSIKTELPLGARKYGGGLVWGPRL